MATRRLGKTQVETAKRRLQGQFSEGQIVACKQLGAHEDIPFRDKIRQLFDYLSDPLLSVFDVVELLDQPQSQNKIQEALDQLVADGDFEFDTDSTRPLFKDPGGGDETLYRLKANEFLPLRLVGLETEVDDDDEGQTSPGMRYYQFSCDGRLIRQIANIERFDAITGEGAQREEIRKHIDKISEGMAEGVQVPNSVLLVFDPERVVHSSTLEGEIGDAENEALATGNVFINRDETSLVEYPNPFDETLAPVQRLAPVEIVIPYRRAAFNSEKVLMIADGQQRTAALALTSIDAVPSYILTVNAILANSKNAAQEVFAVANATRPIKADFSTLMRAVAAGNPRPEQYPAIVAKALAVNTASPFHDLVSLPGGASKRPIRPVAFMSLESGVTHIWETLRRMDSSASVKDLELVATRFFSITRSTWPHAWGERPQISKLMHGVGIKALSSWFASTALSMSDTFPDIYSDEFWNNIQSRVSDMRTYCVEWRLSDAEVGSKLHQDFYKAEVQPRGNTFQDISKLTNALRAAGLKRW